jgi:cell division protein FtsB
MPPPQARLQRKIKYVPAISERSWSPRFDVFARLRPYLPTAALAFLIFYFGFHAFTGERGLLSSEQRNAALTAKRIELEELRAQRQDLEARATLLRDTSLSADLLEERARSLLGFAHPKDYVIRVKP